MLFGGNASGTVQLKLQYPRLAQVIKLTKTWAQSVFKCMDYVKRKVTRAVRHPPSDPVAFRDQFGKTVHDHRGKHDVSKRLTFNSEQIAVFITTCNRYIICNCILYIYSFE